MKHSLPKYLEDMRLSINDFEMYMMDVPSVEYLENNQLKFDAICRRFTIIGEALTGADKLDPLLPITDKKKIIGLRNIIVHDYDTVRIPDLWAIVKNYLPILKSEVEAILKEFE